MPYCPCRRPYRKHRRYRHQRRDRDHHLGQRLDVVGSYPHRLALHPDVVLRRRNLDVVLHRLQQDVVHPDEELRHRLDVVHPDEELRHRCVMERKDCFHPDVLPDEEFPFPDLPQMGCCPDAGCLELEKEELELEAKELLELQLQELEFLQQALP